MNAVVTGGSGFIGSHLVEQLTARGTPTTVIDARLGPRTDGVDYIRARIQDCTIDRVLPLGPDTTVYHLAARPGVQPSWNEFRDYSEQNIVAMQHLLEACVRAKVKRFVFASSSSVYNVQSPYGMTKVAGEALCAAYYRAFGLPCSVLRFFTVYGERQRPDMAFSKWFKALRTGQPITMYRGRSRDFSYGCPVPLEMVIQSMCRVTGREVPVHLVDAPVGDPKSTCARNPIPYTLSLEEGLRRQWNA